MTGKKKSNKKIVRKRFVRVCPVCGSTEVRLDQSNRLSSTMGLPAVHVCNKCGRGGPFPEVEETGLAEFRKNLPENVSESKRHDYAYGKFVISKYWKVAGPICILFALVLLYAAFFPKNCDISMKTASIEHIQETGERMERNIDCKDLPGIRFDMLIVGLIFLLVGTGMINYAYRKRP